jgi:hypothetical protein
VHIILSSLGYIYIFFYVVYIMIETGIKWVGQKFTIM